MEPPSRCDERGGTSPVAPVEPCSSALLQPTVCLWLIGNPVSGQGKGASVIEEVTAELVGLIGPARVRTMTSSAFFALFSVRQQGAGGDAREESHVDLGPLRRTVQEMNDAPFLLRPTPPPDSSEADGTNVKTNSGSGNVCVFIVLTQEAKDGVNVAQAVATMNCHTRWRKHAASGMRPSSPSPSPHNRQHSAERMPYSIASPTTVTASDQWLHVVGVVGGDGSLSDVVNGLCWGTLSTYRALMEAFRQEERGHGRASDHHGTVAGRCVTSHTGQQPCEDGKPVHRAAVSVPGADLPSEVQDDRQEAAGPVRAIGIRGPGVVTSRRHAADTAATPSTTTMAATAETAGCEEGRPVLCDAQEECHPDNGNDVAVNIGELPTLEKDPLLGEDAVGNAVPSPTAAASSGCVNKVNDSHYYYWHLASDKTILRHFLPGMLYTPGGTGADFAKLKLCCTNAQEAADVFLGIVENFFEQNDRLDRCHNSGQTPPPPHQQRAAPRATATEDGESNFGPIPGTSDSATAPPNRPVVERKSCSQDAPLQCLATETKRFLSFEVDVGRITFPKTGHSTFFINECSIGMSCDVVERGEHFKHSRLMTALGGRLLFASSAAISLFLMAPKNVRVARLAPMPRLPSAFSSRANSSPPLGHTRRDPPHQVVGRVIAEPRLPLHLRNSAMAWDIVKLDKQFLQTEQLRQQQRLQAGKHSQLQQDYYRFFTPAAGLTASKVDAVPSAFYAMPREGELRRVRYRKGGRSEAAAGNRNALSKPLSNRDNAAGASSEGTEDYSSGCAVTEAPLFCEDPESIRAMLDLRMKDDPEATATEQPADRGGVDGKSESDEDSLNALEDAERYGVLPPHHLRRNHSNSDPQWVYFESSTWAFGNGRWYGGGMHVTPHANPTDGLLSCTNWVATVLPFVSGVFSLYTGGHVNWRSTTTLDGERFVVDVGPLPDKVMRKQKAARAKARAQLQQQERREDWSASAATDWDDERLVMFMEADGELLEELPAVVELGGIITFFTPNTRKLKQSPPCFGAPAPGTVRAFLAQQRPQQHPTRTPSAQEVLGAEAQAAASTPPSQCETSDTVAVGVAMEAEPETPNAFKDPFAADEHETDVAEHPIVAAPAEKRVGWLARSWQGVKRWLAY